MFDFNDDDLLIENNERKPNRYAAKALIVGIIALAICIFLNEIGVFHVEKVMMRITGGVAVFICALPQFFVHNDEISGKRRFKYVILSCVLALMFLVQLSFFIFSAPFCLLPLLLAAQYNSKKFSTLAIAATIAIIVVAVPLGCVLNFWQPEFLSFLLNYSLGVSGEYNEEAILAGTSAAGVWTMILNITLFISLPWIMCILLSSTIIQLMTKKSSENIAAQLEIRRLSRVDSLTGLYNANVYRKLLRQDLGRGTVGVLFFDVDGLKKVNDTYGHEFGDLLLSSCAKSLDPLFDDKCCGFRVGGDEFVVLVDTSDPAEVDRKKALWEESVRSLDFGSGPNGEKIEYHMSVGASFGDRLDIKERVSEADRIMYEHKRAYKKNADVSRGGVIPPYERRPI